MMSNNHDSTNMYRGNSTEIDYGDVPENMDEEQMRAYLTLESKLVMPNQKKRDSFEDEWKNKRNKYAQPSPKTNQYKVSNSNNSNNNQPQFAYQTQINNNYNNKNNQSTTKLNNTQSTSTYTDNDYTMVDRMSTVTMVSNKSDKNKRGYSFKKQQVPQQMQQNVNLPPLNQSSPPQQPQQHANGTNTFPYNPNMPMQHENGKNMTSNHHHQAPVSALSKQIKPTQHQQQQSGIGSNVIQSRNANNKLVIKQMPYSKKTHAMVNIHVEISAEHIEHIIVYFFKHYSVEQFINFLKTETNNGAFSNCEIDIFVADDEGDLDDDFPAPEMKAIIANLGLTHFYIKISNANDAERNDIRRSTKSYKSQLMTTEQVEKMESLHETFDDESDDGSSQRTGSCCIIL